MEYCSIKLDVKHADDKGAVEGHAALFGTADQNGDIIEPGAFEPIKRSVKMFVQHNSFGLPIGVWDDVHEDTKGLFVKGRISTEVEKGRELLAMIELGAIDGLSIGFKTLKFEARKNNEGRLLKKLDLFEVSFVSFPMHPGAVLDLNSLTTVRELELALRDAGFSRKSATGIAAHGFHGLSDQRDAGRQEQEDKAIAAILAKINNLNEAINVR